MTWAFITGAIAGLGAYFAVRIFIKPRANVLSTIARIDAGRGGYTSGATTSAAGKRVLGGVDRAREFWAAGSSSKRTRAAGRSASCAATSR